MLLEFTLPAGSAGMAAGMIYQALNRQIKEINNKHGTRIVQHLREGYKYVIECTEKDYTVLCLVWVNYNQWHRWRVVEAKDLGETLQSNRNKVNLDSSLYKR